MKRVALLASCLCVLWAAPVAAEPCHQHLGWFDKWVVLPFSGGAGFRDVVSTVRTLERVKTAREAGVVYRVLSISPTENPEAFAWIRGTGTAYVILATATAMSSCRPSERHVGRWIAIGHGVASVLVARHSDRIARPR